MITPSKKVTTVIALALVSVSSIIGGSIVWKAKQLARPQGMLVAGEVDPSIQRHTVADDSDKDGDGLLKWQESLWQTSDSDSDSDKDGTSDGDEVLAGRNPTDGSANDKIAVAASADAEYEPAYTDPTTLTSRVAQTVFANYAKFSSQGEFNEADGVALASQVAIEAAKETAYSSRYSFGSITTIAQPNRDEIRYFANTMISIIFDGLKEIGTNPKAFDDLSIVANSYSNTAKRLTAVPAPMELATTYLQIINNLDGVGYALSLIDDYNNDPARALLALRDYAAVSETHAQLFVVVQNYLKSNGILFSASEPALAGFPELLNPADSAVLQE